MSDPLVKEASVWQGSDVVLMARIRNIDGAYIQQSDLSSIALTVYDRNDDMAVVVGPLALTISSVVFNALQPWDGVLWTADRTGYNFKCRVAGAAAFPDATDYRVDAIFTLTDGTKFPVQFNLTALEVP